MPNGLSDLRAAKANALLADEALARAMAEAGRVAARLDEALKTGDAETIQEANAAAEAVKAELEAARASRNQSSEGFATLDRTLKTQGLTFARRLAMQERTLPFALLPFRIETRFMANGDLKVRVFPDQIHLRRHVDEISTAEAKAGRRYWQGLFDKKDEQELWSSLAAGISPERARFIVEQTRPANHDKAGEGPEPQFPDVDATDEPASPRAQARLLPAAWCAILVDGAGVRSKPHWSEPVQAPLAMSPAGDLMDALTEVPGSVLKIDDAARWLVDFNLAAQVGMALTIPAADLPAEISRLIVVGSDWATGAADSARHLKTHLEEHSWTDGFSLVPPGTPTNNSAARPSGFDSRPRARLQDTKPQQGSGEAAPETDLLNLCSALGVPSAAPLLEGCAGTARAYDPTVAAVHDALWGASFGFYLGHALDPWFPKDSLGHVREHLVDHVRPDGPLPTMRIGKQPYGILPVLATRVTLENDSELQRLSGFEEQIARMLGRIRTMISSQGPDGERRNVLGDIPTLHGDSDTPIQTLLADILKLGPLCRTAKVRPTLNRATRGIGEGPPTATSEAYKTHRALVSEIFGPLRGGDSSLSPGIDRPLIYELLAPKRPEYRLDAVPWVAANLDDPAALGATVSKMKTRLADAASSPRSVPGLLAISAEQAETLFEGLLLLSGAYDYWESGRRLIEHLTVPLATMAIARAPGRSSAALLSTEMFGVESLAQPPQDHVAAETPRQILQLTTELTGNRHILGWIDELAGSNDPPLPARNAARFRKALDVIETCSAADVDRALRGLLDLSSHRLDAWITSLATRRLADQRRDNAEGVHIGCYGMVHDLRRDTTRDSEGYLHLPSIDHAVTASILRSGHMANREEDAEAFAIRMTAPRVRKALELSEGLAGGQRLGALLGYDLEKALVETRLLAKFILPLRRAFPLAEVGDDVPTGPSEAIAARDVVDGLKLAETIEAEGMEAVFTAMRERGESSPSAAEAEDLKVHFERVVSEVDAFADLWTVEAAHNFVRGNDAGTAAATATLDRQERPPEPRAMHTPRASWQYVQRVVWALPANARAEGWPVDLEAKASPVANAIAAKLMGDPARFRLAATIVDENDVAIASEPERILSIEDLGMSPLAILRASIGSSAAATRLEQKVAAKLAAQAVMPEGSGLKFEPGAGAPGLAELQALAGSIRPALFGRPWLSPEHFVAPAAPAAATIDNSEMEAAATRTRTELDKARSAFDSLVSATGPSAAIARAAEAAQVFVAVPDWLLVPPANVEPAVLQEQVQAIHAALAALLAKVDAIAAPERGADEAEERFSDRVAEAHIEHIRLMLGNDFPLCPSFAMTGDLLAPWTQCLSAQTDLLGPRGSREIHRWLRQHALVRAQVDVTAAALDAAVWTGGDGTSASVVQLPPGASAKWVALPFEGKDPPRDIRMSAVVFGSVEAGKMAGLLLDEWLDSVPEEKTATSIAFHYDAPASRPPQAILLAVDPGIGTEPGWTLDGLVTAVEEAFDLAQLRLLRPDQIRGHGAVLPTTFLPRNLSEEAPSLDLLGLAQRFGTLGLSQVLGKVGP